MSSDEEVLQALAARMSGVWHRDVTLLGGQRLSGGASRQTWAADLQAANVRRVILRRDPPDGSFDPLGMRREAAVLSAVAATGALVPQVLDTGGAAEGLASPYLVMERLEGEAIPRRILREEKYGTVRAELAVELGRQLALVHSTPLEELTGLPDGDQLADLTEVYRRLSEPRPVVEIALAWLRAHRPAAVQPALVHGDFRLGNLMVDDDGLTGILDWELAHCGDPAEDLGWLCVRSWRFGAPLPVAGLGTREQLLAGYRLGGGRVPLPQELHWWEVFGTVRWLLLCRFQAERHLSGAEESMELAALGRSVCESEYDVLLVLDLLGDHGRRVAPPDSVVGLLGDGSPHDRPFSDELLSVVSGHLEVSAETSQDGRDRFHHLVARNILAVVRRQLRLGPGHAVAHQKRMAAVGCAAEAELAGELAAGRLQMTEPAVTSAVVDAVLDRLEVANPSYPA